MLHPYIKPNPRADASQTSWAIPALCAAYYFPTGLPGGGVIGLYEAAGGWVPSDIQQFATSIGMPMPSITDVSLDGTQNSNQSPRNDADVEVALDIQMAAAAYFYATGKAATIIVFWGQDIGQAFVAAAKAGAAAFGNSWGDDEANWGAAACEAMEAAAITATGLGMTIFAAAGDNDSSDGGPTPANVDAPGSCPHVVCCGGTSMEPMTPERAEAIIKTRAAWTKIVPRNPETVWNDNPGQTNGEGTGGGYSTVFPIQAYQIGAPPAPAKEKHEKSPGKGRMVPDVCAVADPQTGIEIVCYGEIMVVGGTSCVAPFFAGFTAAFGQKFGFLGPVLWENQTCFNDITVGSNGEFSARVGPDPCSGIGSPMGTKLAALLNTGAPAASLSRETRI
jgi:kumamolisin